MTELPGYKTVEVTIHLPYKHGYRDVVEDTVETVAKTVKGICYPEFSEGDSGVETRIVCIVHESADEAMVKSAIETAQEDITRRLETR